MVNRLKVINFLQDFGCARLDQLQKLYGEENNNFKNVLDGNMVSIYTFLTKESLLYHIIVADEENKKGIVKLANSYPLSLPKADRLILAFPDDGELENIDCDIPFLYTAYPELEVLNN